MSKCSVRLETVNPLRSRATLDRVSSSFTDDSENRASTRINGVPDEETLGLRDEVLSTSMFEEIVGSSDAICRVTAQVMRVAPRDATVLITGESGTGKGVDRPRDSPEIAQVPVGFHKDELRCYSPFAGGCRALRL